MTNAERIQARISRDKVKRAEKRMKRSKQYCNWDDVFGFWPLYQAYHDVSKASRKRTKTQIWNSNISVNTRKVQIKLSNQEWKSKGFNYFDIKERGKLRHIASVNIEEKGIQNAICNNCLIPILRPSLIYDNGASLREKGTSFARARFDKHLHEAFRRWGLNCYIYFFDFSSYFANISQDILIENVSKYIYDEKMMKMFCQFVQAYKNGGLGLGSQVSQISAVFYPNKIDHLIKDKLGIKYYARYMDDGYIILDDLNRLKEIVRIFENVCENSGVVLNMKKCHITKLSNKFTFLKTRYYITNTGKIVHKINRKSAKKERDRLRKYKKFIGIGLMTRKQVYLIFHSWILSLDFFNNYNLIKNMIRFYNDLFDTHYYPIRIKKRSEKRLSYIAKSVA